MQHIIYFVKVLSDSRNRKHCFLWSLTIWLVLCSLCVFDSNSHHCPHLKNGHFSLTFLQCPHTISLVCLFHSLLLYGQLMEINVSEFSRKDPKKCKEAHNQSPFAYGGLRAIPCDMQNDHADDQTCAHAAENDAYWPHPSPVP